MGGRKHKQRKKEKIARRSPDAVQEQPSADPTTQNPPSNPGEGAEVKLVREKPKDNRVAAWGVAVAAIAAFIYFMQLRVMQEGVHDVQRAFIVGHIGFGDELHPSQPGGPKVPYLSLWIIWLNDGTTTATHARQTAQQGDHEPSDTEFLGDPPPDPAPTASIGAKESVNSGGFNFLISDLTDQYGALRTDKSTYIWGWIAYRDVFPLSAPHVTEKCERLENLGFQDTPPSRPITNFELCKTHNCTDDECPDYKKLIEFAKIK